MGIQSQGYSGLPGGGPWRILPECPAERAHNTVRAYEGRGGNPKCICPRAVEIGSARVKEWSRTREMRRAATRNRNDRFKPAAMILQPKPVPEGMHSPDLSSGICRKEIFRDVVDAGFSDQASRKAIEGREQAKSLCSFCPVLEECREWVEKAEVVPGSWGGVWGGLDPWDRMGVRIVVEGHGLSESIKVVPLERTDA